MNPTPGRPPLRLGSLDAVLAVLPHLLGFTPDHCLVVLGIGGPHARIGVTFRYDLPDPPEPGLAADIAAHARTVLGRQDLTMAIVVGYGPGRIVTPVVEAMVPAMLDAGIVMQDVLRVEDGRFWSYMCSDPVCCPPDGVPFDPAAHPAAGALAAAGLTARRDRAELARTIAPAVESAESMAAAVGRARLRAAQLIRQVRAGPGARERPRGGGPPVLPLSGPTAPPSAEGRPRSPRSAPTPPPLPAEGGEP